MLRSATAYGIHPLVKAMTDAGINVNAPSPAGLSALYVAIETALPPHSKDRDREIDTLLAAGANPNLVPMGRYPALHSAAAAGLPHIVKRLLSAGADPSAISGGMTALQLAKLEQGRHFAPNPGITEAIHLLLVAEQANACIREPTP